MSTMSTKNPIEGARIGAGLVFPALAALVIDRNDVGVFAQREQCIEVSDVEGDMLTFLTDGVLETAACGSAEKLTDALKDENTLTLAEAIREYHQYRAARRHLCNGLQRFIDAVRQDEDLRNAAEEAALTASGVSPQIAKIPEPAVIDTDPGLRELSEATLTALRAYEAGNPEVCQSEVDFEITEEMYTFLESLVNRSVLTVHGGTWDEIKVALSKQGGCAVEDAKGHYRKAVRDRRAFYAYVRAFLNDPGTITALAQDEIEPDYEAILAEMRVEGIPIHGEKSTRAPGAPRQSPKKGGDL